MRVSLGLVVLFLASCTKPVEQTGAFFDPTFATLIPADTNLLLGVNVEKLVKTPVYQQYLTGGRLKIVEDFSIRTGIDPAQDLWQILLVSNGRQSYWLGRGKFSDALMAPDFSKPGVKRFGYKGLTMFGDENRALMMLNSSTAVLGETAVLRTLADQRPSIHPPTNLLTRVNQIPHGAHVWGVWTGGDFALPMQGNFANAQRMLRRLSEATMFLDLADHVQGSIQATGVSEKTAEDAGGALDALLALSRLNPKTATLAQGIQASRSGKDITVKLDAPAALAALLLN